MCSQADDPTQHDVPTTTPRVVLCSECKHDEAQHDCCPIRCDACPESVRYHQYEPLEMRVSAAPDLDALTDKVHDVMIYVNGCDHAKFLPSECSTIARRLWAAGVRITQ